MSISITCRCGGRFGVSEEHQGRQVRCPRCRAVMTVPVGAPAPGFDVFISYSKHDRDIAQQVCATLEAQGVRCWIAPRNIDAGMRWGEAIIDGIHSSRSVVLIFSSHANDSDQVWREVERAASKGLPILPLRTENIQPSKRLELFIAGAHWMDAFEGPLSQHLWRLPKNVRAILGPTGGAAAVPPPAAQLPFDRDHAASVPREVPGATRRSNVNRKLVFLGLGGTAAVVICVVAVILTMSDAQTPPAPAGPDSEAADIEPLSNGDKAAETVGPSGGDARAVRTPAGATRQPDAGDDEPPATRNRSPSYVQGLRCMKRRDFDGAIRHFTDDIRLNPEHVEAFANRGLAYFNKEDFARAATDFDRWVQLDPTNPSTYAALGQAHQKLKRHDQAVEDFSTAIELNPQFLQLRYLRGQSFLREKRYDEAISDFSEFIRREPYQPVPYIYRGQCYAGKGEHEKAIENFTEAIEKHPRSAEAYFRRSLSYAAIGQTSPARADRSKALRLDPGIAEAVAAEDGPR